MGVRFGRPVGVAPPAVEEAQQGSQAARDRLLREYTPFVVKVASRAAGRYLRPGVDEEISVALMAFNEAIDSFQTHRGSFLSFAETVIRRRLVDHFRRNKARSQEVVLTDLDVEDEEGEVKNAVLDRVAESAWALAEQAEARRQEISEFQAILARFGMSLGDLVKNCPKHRDARARATEVARQIVDDRELARHLLERRELPLKRLEQKPGIHRKMVERHRRYIVAVCLVLLHDLPYLQEYVQQPSEEVGV